MSQLETPQPQTTIRVKTDLRGLSSVISFHLEADTKSVMLDFVESRRQLRSGGPACYIVNHLEDASGRAWIEQLKAKRDYLSFCRTCDIRATVGHAEATLLISKRAYPAFAMGTVFVQLLALDCVTGSPLKTPRETILNIYTSSEVPRTPKLDIHLYFPSSLWQQMLPSQKLKARLAEELRLASESFWQGSIELRVKGRHFLSEKYADKVSVRKGDWSKAQALFRIHEGRAGIPVFLLSCLQRINPLLPNGKPKEIGGLVGNLPGAPNNDGGMAGILLSVGRCDTPLPLYSLEGFGRLLTHELGHYLGLPHTIEADGYRDPHTHLDDEDIMHFNYLTHQRKTLSSQQLSIVLAHPLLRSGR